LSRRRAVPAHIFLMYGPFPRSRTGGLACDSPSSLPG
jgi:hypothetical protein